MSNSNACTSTVVISGIECIVHKEKFPDGKRCDVYTFTVPGWDECSITGKREAKRVIHGRLSPEARWAYGIR